MIDKSFWKNKKVLVTGHTGFKGSWLSIWLNSMGANLVGFAQAPPNKNYIYDLANISQDMTSVIGDIRDLSAIQETIDKYNPEIIIHMAAQALVRKSYNDPIETYSTNVMGTLNLFEAARKNGSTKIILNVTSDKCYENKERDEGYKEDEAMGGYDPYSSSKGCAELLTSAYSKSYFNLNEGSSTVLASARAGNVIGGGDWAEDRLIPDIIRGILNKETIKIRNPKAIRPWQHVLEPLSGYLLLTQKLWEDSSKYVGGWNFGPDEGDVKEVGQIVEQMHEQWGGFKWEIDSGNHPHEAKLLRLNCEKAKKELSWKPNWNIDIAVSKIVEWYKAYEENKDIKAVTLSQISEYESTL